jgi:hypothetical protein
MFLMWVGSNDRGVKMSFRVSFALGFLVLAGFAVMTALPLARGQTLASTAAFSGTVSDSSGARIANAKVSLTNPEKGITRVFKSDAEGSFSFTLLPAATYTFTVEAPGFKTFRQRGTTLEVGQSASQNVILTIGSTDEVEVTATALLLQADNANIGAEVSSKLVTELPLNLRNVLNFVQLNSSVNNNAQQQILQGGGEQGTADQDVSFFNFGGGYFGTTAFLLDGAWDTGNGWGGVEYVPSPENVQEFKVQQNSFTAQYGWSTGNVVNLVTRSGGSSLHGVVYEFLRNGSLDANNYFNNLNGLHRPNVHRNQFGFAVGGPVYIPRVYEQRTKTFFFFNYEGHREKNPASTAGTVPTTAFRTGDFSALLGAQVGTDASCRPIMAGQIYDPFSTRQVIASCGPNVGNTVFIRDPIGGNLVSNSINGIDPVGKNLIGYYPNPINGALQNNWAATAAAATNSDEYSIRIDHNFTENTRLYGRFSDKHEFKEVSPPYYGTNNPGGPGQRNPNNRWNAALGLSQVFSPTFLVSVNLGVVRWVEGNDVQSKGFKPSTLELPAFIDPYSYQFPVVNVSGGYEGLGPQQGAGQGAFPHNVGSASVDFTRVRGPHSLSFGYMAVALDENGGRIHPTTFNFDTGFTSGPDPTNPTSGTGNGLASMLLGTPSSGGTGIAISEVTRTWYHGLYLQDDWKATRKLTLNLGLRWEVQRPIRERYNRQAYFDYNAVNPISSGVGQNYLGELKYSSSSNRGLYETNYKNFAPRIGLAYQILPKFVMRAGYGIFYPASYRGFGPAPGFTSDTPFVASTNGGLNPSETLSSAFSGGLVPLSGSSLGGLTNVGFSISAIAPNRKATYVQQWMYGFQYAPTANDVVDVAYVGNHGVRMISDSINRNQLDPKYFSMGNALLTQVANPFFGHIMQSGCGLDQPTVAQGQLLRPYPEFCDINEIQDPVGFSRYNSLQASYTHRLSKGLTLLASYTFSKFIDNVGGANNWASASSNFSTNIRNVYNLAAEKSVDATDVPHSVVLSYVYEIPVGKGKKFGSKMHPVLNAITGGWQTSGIATFKQGFPLAIAASNGLNYFGAGQHPDIVSDYHVLHPNRKQWFNPLSFVPAAPWTLGNSPRYLSDLRAPGYNNWDMSIQKFFPIQESVGLQFRLDAFDVFNHTNFYKPNTFFGPPPPLGSFSTINTSFSPRLVQAALKLYW